MARKEGILGNPEAQSRLRKREKLRERQRAEDIKAVMGTPEGRRTLWHLIDDRCGLSSGTFTGEALSMAHAEGKRAVGRELMTAVQEHASELYVLMLQEALAAQREDDIQRRDAESAPNPENDT